MLLVLDTDQATEPIYADSNPCHRKALVKAHTSFILLCSSVSLFARGRCLPNYRESPLDFVLGFVYCTKPNCASFRIAPIERRSVS
jgi:hypothetical protein